MSNDPIGSNIFNILRHFSRVQQIAIGRNAIQYILFSRLDNAQFFSSVNSSMNTSKNFLHLIW